MNPPNSILPSADQTFCCLQVHARSSMHSRIVTVAMPSEAYDTSLSYHAYACTLSLYLYGLTTNSCRFRTIVFPLSTGGEASVSWAFIQDAKLQENYPEYLCPAMIVHGLNDTVVPAALTRSLVEGRWVACRGWSPLCALFEGSNILLGVTRIGSHFCTQLAISLYFGASTLQYSVS